MADRGEWRHRGRAAQLLSFSGLQWGSITPTDFDLFVDFGNRGFVIGELKYGDTRLPRGQELALERAVDAMARSVPTLGFVASHDVAEGEVFVADATVIKIRWRGEWKPELGTVARLLDRFHEHVSGKKAA